MTTRKRGRPPAGGEAMSDAERAARYRAARRQAAESRSAARNAEALSDAVILDALRIAIADGRALDIWRFTQVLRDRYPTKS